MPRGEYVPLICRGRQAKMFGDDPNQYLHVYCHGLVAIISSPNNKNCNKNSDLFHPETNKKLSSLNRDTRESYHLETVPPWKASIPQP